MALPARDTTTVRNTAPSQNPLWRHADGGKSGDETRRSTKGQLRNLRQPQGIRSLLLPPTTQQQEGTEEEGDDSADAEPYDDAGPPRERVAGRTSPCAYCCREQAELSSTWQHAPLPDFTSVAYGSMSSASSRLQSQDGRRPVNGVRPGSDP